MSDSPPVVPAPSPAPTLTLAIALGSIAVLACGIPFVPPLAVVAVPLAAAALVMLARLIFRGTHWSPGCLTAAGVALALNGFALFLALGKHHLIDWLEGH